MGIVPKKFTAYYGYPGLVNGANGNVNTAVNTFKDYDLISFGEGIELSSHPDHNKTDSIINHSNMTNTEVYGYVNGLRTETDFKNRVDLWKNMGVKGILLDQFGYDFGVLRSKQNTFINYIHNKNLKAFIDVWNPDDVFSSAIDASYNPLGLAPVVNSNDWYLAESYQIVNGSYQDPTFWKTKANKMVNYKNIYGTKMACITTYNNVAFDQIKADYSYYSCVLYNFDAWGWGEYLYSALSSSLPFRNRKSITGTLFKNEISENNEKFERNTNIGVSVNTTNHTTNSITS